MKGSDGFVYASDNKGACVPEQDPQTKLATGTGTLILSARGMEIIFYRYFKKSNYIF